MSCYCHNSFLSFLLWLLNPCSSSISDAKRMTFFLHANYPPDYSAFISRPMDWEKVNRTLKKRQYETINDVIGDLRLIFTNALKYNARLRGTQTASGQAYESAIFMSSKLEIAVNKMIVTVSDRLERERIDHNNAERELEAADRAEEEQMREKWKQDNDGRTPTPTTQIEIAQKIRFERKGVQREPAADFEEPFFEDIGHHESSYVEVFKVQKAIYEKQTQEMSKLRVSMKQLGASIFARMRQREEAQKWVEEEGTRLTMDDQLSLARDGDNEGASEPLETNRMGSALEKEGRTPIKLEFALLKKKPPTKKPAPSVLLDF